MIIRSGNIFKHYTKIDNYVTSSRKISDGAYRVYAYYSGLKTGDNFVDQYVCKALDIQQQVLTKRKKELTDAGFVLSERLSGRTYVLYIGNTEISATGVKMKYEEEENKRLAGPKK